MMGQTANQDQLFYLMTLRRIETGQTIFRKLIQIGEQPVP